MEELQPMKFGESRICVLLGINEECPYGEDT